MRRFLTTPRLLALALALLAVAACGPEAPPRAGSATSAPQPYEATGAQTQPSAPTAGGQTAGDPRALGDPNAPITIIEYSDYQ